MRRRILAIGAAAALALSGLAMPAHAADQAQLSVLHAVPGLTVDVYVNGERTLNNFKPGTLAGPLKLDAGTYSVAITAADAKDDSDPAIGPIDLKLDAGKNYTAVAHLKENGDPTATLFTNDTSKTDAGQGRLTVRHVAAAPAVDILAGGKAVVEGLEEPGRGQSRPGRRHHQGLRRGSRNHQAGDRPGRGRRRGRHPHDRVRVGLAQGRQPEAGHPDHLGAALRTGWGPCR